MSNKDLDNKLEEYIYVAGPYSSDNPKVMKKREQEHSWWTGYLMHQGYLVYSPIAETASIARSYKMTGTDWNTWRRKDLRQLHCHTAMFILTLDGWKESRGVRGEIKHCIKLGIPISLVEVTTHTIIPIDNKELLSLLEVESENLLND